MPPPPPHSLLPKAIVRCFLVPQGRKPGPDAYRSSLMTGLLTRPDLVRVCCIVRLCLGFVTSLGLVGSVSGVVTLVDWKSFSTHRVDKH